jgi:hypothetical protein
MDKLWGPFKVNTPSLDQELDESTSSDIEYSESSDGFVTADDDSVIDDLKETSDEISNLIKEITNEYAKTKNRTEDKHTFTHEISSLAKIIKDRDWWQGTFPNIEYTLRAVTEGIPVNYKEAMRSKDKHEWQKAMEAEMESIRRNKTYKLKKIKNGERAIGCKWVYKLKLNPDGTINKYKARLVAKGFLQKKGKDYNETFAPVAKFKSIRLLLALAATHAWEVFHDDATTAFLNGILKETVLMDQPEGYLEGGNNYKWELLKTLYGLKQAPREWNEVLHKFVISKGFKRCHGDPCLYIKRTNDEILIVGVYVDDILTTGNSKKAIFNFRKDLKDQFRCSEGEKLNWCVGMEVKQHENEITINQNQYIKQKLEVFNHVLEPNTKRSTPLDNDYQNILIHAKNSTEIEQSFPYREIVGSLMYAATGTRPDIQAAVSIASRYLSNPRKIHCDMVRRILYYLRHRPDYQLVYKKGGSIETVGYSDASWANNED